MSAYMLLCNFTGQGVRTTLRRETCELRHSRCFLRRNSTRSSRRSLERQAQKRPHVGASKGLGGSPGWKHQQPEACLS